MFKYSYENMPVGILRYHRSRQVLRFALRTLRCLKRDPGLSFGTLQAGCVWQYWTGYVGFKVPNERHWSLFKHQRVPNFNVKRIFIPGNHYKIDRNNRIPSARRPGNLASIISIEKATTKNVTRLEWHMSLSLIKLSTVGQGGR